MCPIYYLLSSVSSVYQVSYRSGDLCCLCPLFRLPTSLPYRYIHTRPTTSFIIPLFCRIDHSKGLLINIVRFCFVTFIIRCRFYFIFALNDSISNAAGLGFEGYDKQNKPRWGLARNYDIWGMETSMNMRNSINLWNITSALWLRRSVELDTALYA